MDVLLSFGAALVSLRLAGRLLGGTSLRLGSGAAQLRCGRGGDDLGLGSRLGRAVVPRLLPRRRAALGAAARDRVAAAARAAVGRATRAPLLRAGRRRRGRDAAARSIRRRPTSRAPGSRRRVPASARDRRQLTRRTRGRWSSRRPRCASGRSGTACSSPGSRRCVASALTQTAVAAAAACFALAAGLLYTSARALIPAPRPRTRR